MRKQINFTLRSIGPPIVRKIAQFAILTGRTVVMSGRVATGAQLPSRVGGSVVYGMTTGWGAFSLLRGQLSWMTARGWDVHLVADPDARSLAAAEREGVPLVALPMRRSISMTSDLCALI